VFERAKSFVKSTFPAASRAYRRVSVKVCAAVAADVRPEVVFSEIYRRNVWKNSESVSGRGSTLERTRVVREQLPEILKDAGASTLFDAACGDFNWMREVELLGIRYIGADIVRELVERNQSLYGRAGRDFRILDITVDALPKSDVVLCRDCFIHLSFGRIRAAVANFKRSESVFLLATTHTRVKENRDIQTGDWRSVNLQLPPFDFPAPLRLINEDEESGKCLALWRLGELRK
jgi:hypothetical protein